MRRLLLSMLATLVMMGCSKSDPGSPYVKISPVITRVTGLFFDMDDRIGLTITKDAETYAENVPMTYNGTTFTSSLLWYDDRQEHSTLTAYYPYSEQGIPYQFTIETDQRAGLEASDMLIAVKTDAKPASAPVGMTFFHVMSRLTIYVNNSSDAAVTGITLGGSIPGARVDFTDSTVSVQSAVPVADITTYEFTPGATYQAILVPQTVSLTVTTHMSGGGSYSKTLPAAQLEGGKRYDVSLAVSDSGLEVLLSGDIGDWEDGGSLGGDNDSESLVYGGATYPTAVIGGRVWMARNLRYVPDNVSMGAGIWYPGQNNSPVTNPDYIRERGMLYSFTTAIGGTYTAGIVQGICPDGWHIPDIEELQQLIGSPEYDQGFLNCAGMWNPSTNRYASETKGYLMSSTSSDGIKYSALAFTTAGGLPTTTQWDAGYGVSLRCVKDL